MNNLQQIKQLLDIAEGNIRQAKSLLFASAISSKAKNLSAIQEEGTTIEGVFDGESMIDTKGKNYPIPANYASKSKLVPGDVLKLTILSDGSFIFKQIGPVKRKKIIGVLEELESGKYTVRCNKRSYRVLLASVTYFKAKPGDSLTIIVPDEDESEWAAVENVIQNSNL